MNIAALAAGLAERYNWPDALLRAGISRLVERTCQSGQAGSPDVDRAFAESMASRPVALNTCEANEQHYEIPPDFFGFILGPHRKYSSCLFNTGKETLAEGEKAALAETCLHAGIRDGETILELGCGWGSLSLWMASHFPAATIVAVSNSRSQRAFIVARAAEAGLGNLRVLTADMNAFDISEKFDRVVSVEMFEHMSNWRELLTRARTWLKPEGRLFLHVFAHRATPYTFDRDDPADWIAQHFFTGGIMPSHNLIRQYGDLFQVEHDWIWSGEHYARTARLWLANFDRNHAETGVILRDVYGADAQLWRRRWRLFFLATEGLFGHSQGQEWGVSHFLLRPLR